MKPGDLELRWNDELIVIITMVITNMITMICMKPDGLELRWSEGLDQGGIGWSPKRKLTPYWDL